MATLNQFKSENKFCFNKHADTKIKIQKKIMPFKNVKNQNKKYLGEN